MKKNAYKAFGLFLIFISNVLHSSHELIRNNEPLLLITEEQQSDEMVGVLPETMPRLPKKRKKEDFVIVDSLKGIVLVNDESALLQGSELTGFHGVRVKGLSIPKGEKKLKSVLSPYLNKPLTRGKLDDIRYAVSNYYLDQHFPLVVVSIPEQELTSGVLQLIVLEATLGEVKVEGNCYCRNNRLKEYVKLKPGCEIDESQIIKDLNFINRNPFRRVNTIYSPGKESGTTDVILSVSDRWPFRVYAGAENTGVKTTGRKRWFSGFNLGDAFGLDHILAYQHTSSFDLHEFHADTLQYIAPLPWHHLLNLYGGYTAVHVDLPLRDMRNHGNSYQASMRYKIPIFLSRYLLHDIIFGFDWKRTNNTIEFNEEHLTFGPNVNLTQFVFGYTGNYERNSFRLDFQGEIFWSPGKMMTDESNSSYNKLRFGARNNWVYGIASLAYLQKLPKSFSFFSSVKGQYSSQTLLPSEQFPLGGYDTVRGYDQRQANMDNGVLVNGEIRSPTLHVAKYLKESTKLNDALQFLAFVDWGWGNDKTSIPFVNKVNKVPWYQYLIGVGPGMRYTIDPYLTARLDWGFKLHHAGRFSGGNSMLHFSFVLSY